MSQLRTSHVHPSRAIALLWVPGGLWLLFALTICSTNPLLSLVVVGSWVATQQVANWRVCLWLDDHQPAHHILVAVIQSVVVAGVLVAASWPLLVWLIPESTNCL